MGNGSTYYYKVNLKAIREIKIEITLTEIL